MKMLWLVLLALAGCASGAASGDGFAPLFNGKDLTGWQAGPGNGWVVEDGVIALKNREDGKEHNADYLWTTEPYGDFILELNSRSRSRPTAASSSGRRT